VVAVIIVLFGTVLATNLIQNEVTLDWHGIMGYDGSSVYHHYVCKSRSKQYSSAAQFIYASGVL
jgi:hypothetical protein